MELEAKVEQFSCQVSNKETNIDSAKDALKMLESEIQAPEVYKGSGIFVSGTMATMVLLFVLVEIQVEFL